LYPEGLFKPAIGAIEYPGRACAFHDHHVSYAALGMCFPTMLQKIKGVRLGAQKLSKFYLIEKMALHWKKRRTQEN